MGVPASHSSEKAEVTGEVVQLPCPDRDPTSVTKTVSLSWRLMTSLSHHQVLPEHLVMTGPKGRHADAVRHQAGGGQSGCSSMLALCSIDRVCS